MIQLSQCKPSISNVTEISYYPSTTVMCNNGSPKVLGVKIVARKVTVKLSLLIYQVF